MAFNKEELRERILNLKEFEKRDIKVKNDIDPENNEWTKQNKIAICGIGENKAYAYVGENYKLLQFRELFLPVLNSIEGPVQGYLADYGGFAQLKVFPELEVLKDGDSKFGLVAMNSVDLSSSIIVKFCVKHNHLQFTMPSSIAGLRKQHSGNVKQVTKDYISMVSGVKEVWRKIVEEFPKYKIVQKINEFEEDSYVLEMEAVLDQLKIGKKLKKRIIEDSEQLTLEGKRYTLWDSFIMVIEEISNGKYKSEVHREKKIAAVCQGIFNYATVLGI